MGFLKHKNIALALAGGGAKGAYAVGVIKYLWEQNIRYYRSIIGTSTGALIATKTALACASGDQKHIDELEYIFRTIEKKDIAIPTRKFVYKLVGRGGSFVLELIKNSNGSIYDNSPLQNLVNKYVSDDDWDYLIKAAKDPKKPIELGFHVSDLQKAEGITITNETHPNIKDLKQAIITSTSIPILFPVSEINDKQLVDGGLTNVIPINSVFKSKYYNSFDAIFTILLDPPTITKIDEKLKNSSEVLFRVLDILSTQTLKYDHLVGHLINIFNSLKKELPDYRFKKMVKGLPAQIKEALFLEERKNSLPLYEIHPESFLGYGFNFKQPIMSDWVDLGYKDAKERFLLNKESIINSGTKQKLTIDTLFGSDLLDIDEPI